MQVDKTLIINGTPLGETIFLMSTKILGTFIPFLDWLNAWRSSLGRKNLIGMGF